MCLLRGTRQADSARASGECRPSETGGRSRPLHLRTLRPTLHRDLRGISGRPLATGAPERGARRPRRSYSPTRRHLFPVGFLPTSMGTQPGEPAVDDDGIGEAVEDRGVEPHSEPERRVRQVPLQAVAARDVVPAVEPHHPIVPEPGTASRRPRLPCAGMSRRGEVGQDPASSRWPKGSPVWVCRACDKPPWSAADRAPCPTCSSTTGVKRARRWRRSFWVLDPRPPWRFRRPDIPNT